MPQLKRYSSCNACKRSRLGCNASSLGGAPCFNCTRKGIECKSSENESRARARTNNHQNHRPSGRSTVLNRNHTGEQQQQQQQQQQSHRESVTHSTLLDATTPAPYSEAQHGLTKAQQASQLHHILWNIFTTVLEPRIGLWVGGSCCPFKSSQTPLSTLISRIMTSLDFGQRDSGATNMIDRTLLLAVYAYSVNWLLLEPATRTRDIGKQAKLYQQKQELSENLWREARQHMYTAMAKPCYRSILALYLFGIIPSSKSHELDGIEDPCLEAALNHYNYLRSRASPNSSSRNTISNLLDSQTVPNLDQPPAYSEIEYKYMTDIAYWFGIISDTTRSLTRCRPPIMLPGRIGESRVWSAVRQRTDAFERDHQLLVDSRTSLSDAKVQVILQHAFAFKMMVWAAIVRVQDAVFHQMSDISLAEALEAVTIESNRFEKVFAPLLSLCQRDFMLLSRSTQLSYALLNIHFQVGTLILADALPSPVTFIDNDAKPYDLALCACLRIVNAVKTALCTECDDGTSNILLLDPYPDLMVEALVRTGSSLFQLHSLNKLNNEILQRMYSVVIQGLEVLAEISYKAATAVPLLRQKFIQSGIGQAGLLLEAAIYETNFAVDNLFDTSLVEELEKQATDPTLVSRTVGQHETDMFMSSFLSEEIQPTALDYLSNNWGFNDCFIDL